MMMRPVKEGIRFSVVIASYNTLSELCRCVQSVLRWTPDCEIIIVDNGSTDGSAGYIKDISEKTENVKAIFNESNRNFGPAQNQGFAEAEGKYLISLNSDCVATDKWAEKMAEIFEREERVAAVGPVSNSSNGRQMIAGDYSGMNVDQISAQVQAQEMGRYVDVGILYGWCLMVSRDFLATQETLFDERFTNAWEDNDLCLRAITSGWRLIVDCSTFLWHDGQTTFKKSLDKSYATAYIENGKKNQRIFYDKWADDRKKKLIAVYRIANCEDYVAKSMAQTSKFADEIICLFARSKDRTKDIALSFPKVVAWEEWNEAEHPFNEQAERDWLLQRAIERGADWVISVDGDEVYEDKFTDMVPSLMCPKNPQVLAYWCNWRTIWETREDGVQMFRADDTFGSFQNYRFFRVLPGMRIKENDNIYNHHCGSAPFITAENLKWLNVRVKHLGYDTEAQRIKKYNFYKAADPRPLAKDVGHKDYRHLVDKNVALKPYAEDCRLSVMTICKNEEALIYDMLSAVEPVADEYVICDTGSTDGTLAEIQRFVEMTGKDVRVFDCAGMFDEDADGMLMNYSQAKNHAKSLCRYEWILNMDADELFSWGEVTSIYGLMAEECDGFLFKVINYLEPPRGPKPSENTYSISETVRLYRNIDELFYSGLIHESLEDATSVRHANGRGSLIIANFPLHHRGYLKERSRIREKIDRYQVINERQFEVSGNADPRPLFNIAAHMFNEGRMEEGVEFYERSLGICPEFWRSRMNLAYHNLAVAKRMIKRTVSDMPQYMLKNNKISEISDFLGKFEFEAPRIG